MGLLSFKRIIPTIDSLAERRASMNMNIPGIRRNCMEDKIARHCFRRKSAFHARIG
jgi:hypothetical protein